MSALFRQSTDELVKPHMKFTHTDRPTPHVNGTSTKGIQQGGRSVVPQQHDNGRYFLTMIAST
jgi:hypothetical protein